jgi:hypothetical protein
MKPQAGMTCQAWRGFGAAQPSQKELTRRNARRKGSF